MQKSSTFGLSSRSPREWQRSASANSIDDLSRHPRDGVIHFEQRTFFRVKGRGLRPDGRKIVQIEFNEVSDEDYREDQATG